MTEKEMKSDDQYAEFLSALLVAAPDINSSVSTYARSNGKRTPIPIEIEHQFQRKTNTNSN